MMRTSKLTAGVMVEAPGVQLGLYQPEFAPEAKDGRKVEIHVCTRAGFDASPFSAVLWNMARKLDEWPNDVSPRGTPYVDIDGVVFSESLLAAVEEFHGPVLWARTRKKINFGFAKSHIALGFKGWSRVAMIAPMVFS